MTTDSLDVFFYGLFMDESLLAAKNIRPVQSAIGYVDGFALRIGERATLLPAPGGRAYGVLMTITAADADVLYSGPSVADYVAESVVVCLPGDIEVQAVCYNLQAEKLAGTNPEYAASLLNLATRLGFPDSYVGQIRSFLADH